MSESNGVMRGRKALRSAIYDLGVSLSDARDALWEHAPDEVATKHSRDLRTASGLMMVLDRIARDGTVDEIHAAFGAPGDYGYDTPIGDALAWVYGVHGGAE